MGTPEFAVPTLKLLHENNYEIAAVVTVPDSKKGRGMNLSESPVKIYAAENGMKILQPYNLKNPEFADQIRSLYPDLIIVVAFKILPKDIFNIPKLGSFNLHASLLPKYRGAAPINWAIIKGETETGVTSFFLKEKVDTGNIIIQKKESIMPDDNAGTLHDKLSILGASVVLDTVRLIERGDVSVTEQDSSLASPAPKIFRDDCHISWDQSSGEIHNFIRGLTPYPGAFTLLRDKSIKIQKTVQSDEKSTDTPGKLIVRNRRLFTACNDNLIEIMELQPEGKKRMGAADFINGLGNTNFFDLSFH